MVHKPSPVMHAMVADKSDAQLRETAAQFGGPAAVMESIVRGLADALGEQAPDAVVGFVAEEDGEQYRHAVRIEAGTTTVLPLPDRVDAVYTASFPDLVRVAAGVLDLPAAIADGRVQVSGDSELAGRVLLSLS